MSIELSMKLLNSDKYYDNLVWEDDLVIDFSCFFSRTKLLLHLPNFQEYLSMSSLYTLISFFLAHVFAG